MAHLPLHAPGGWLDKELAALAAPSAPPVSAQIEAARHARTIKSKPQSGDLGPLFDPIQPGLFG